MKEKLIIRNFGPIKDAELDLGKFTILIGEQATGKSTVAKVLAVCRYFSYIVETTPNDTIVVGYSSFMTGVAAWGLEEHVQKDTYINYVCSHYEVIVKDSITASFKHVSESGDTPNASLTTFKSLTNSISPEFKNLLSELEKIRPAKSDDPADISAFFWTIPTSFFQNDVARVMDNPFYLPTQRGLQSIFSIGKSSIANLSDALFSQLAKMDGIARLFKKDTYIEPLDIYYVNRDGHGFIRKANEEQYYSLYNAASGYQAMIPIVLTIKYYTELKKKTKTLIIEEPELDVFPLAQNKLLQYFSEKQKMNDSMVLVTTHSPYTLTALNNMMYAYEVGQKYPEQVAKEMDRKYWINPEDVSAYLMKADGTCEDIVDREESMIKAEKIDEVSKAINKQFNAIMDIELGVDEEA